MVKYKTIKQFSLESGYSEKAIQRKREKGEWASVSIKAPDGRILINVEEYNKWATQASANDLTNQSRSVSPIKVNAVGKRLNKSPAPIT